MSEANKGKRIKKKEVIDHEFREEYVVTFEDDTVDRAFRSKTIFSASRYPRYYDFILTVRKWMYGKEKVTVMMIA